jgi:phage gp16-like protein
MKDSRARELATIHIARKAIDMDEHVYRGLLKSIGNVNSSSELTPLGRARLIAHFKSCGWKPDASKGSSKRPKRPTPAAENVALCKRIRAQLISLGHLPDTYADGIAKQAFAVDFYEWCTSEQLHKLTAMLAFEQKRKGAPEA